mmetsp:Transcript_5127/g.17874  ORF Transcript_5127/g.17874 Transcript_5127/m.17874 type:complete len:275 (-) Transcript_5127:1165-1989(-)
MAQKPKPSHVRARGRPVPYEALSGWPALLPHRLERRAHPAPLRKPAHVRREEGTGTDRFRDNNHLPGLEPAFPEKHGGVSHAVDTEPQRQLCAFRAVAAGERAPRGAERRRRPRHHLRQFLLHDRLEPERDRGDGERRVRVRAHGPRIAERMHRCNLTKHVRIVHKGAKVVHSLDRDHPGRHVHDGCVVARALDNLRSSRDVNLAQDALEDGRPNLCSASAAAHGSLFERLERLRTSDCRKLLLSPPLLLGAHVRTHAVHLRKVRVLLHPRPVQ